MLAAMVNTSMLVGPPGLEFTEALWLARIAENNVTIPTMTASVIASVQMVDRRVRNLIHSDLTTRGKVTRT